ncbi:MAG: alpha/beta hydrolase [Oscillospiraceae bacterium]|nr:alpha/beta hydrolase [Oscillospiraceae bacterium]
MKKEVFRIENIPAILWGEASDRIYLAVHSKMSDKYEARGLAEKAAQRGFQTISFDLPEHGDRRDENYPCMVWNGVHDLKVIGDYVFSKWDTVCLYGSSLGAYFSLLAYKDLPLRKCVFLSPVLDMERVIRNMMAGVNISEHDLREKQEIPALMGETLYWDYYCYVRDHPIDKWNVPTSILYGSGDAITEYEVVRGFTKRFNCDLTVLEGSEHWFHTERQLRFLDTWLDKHI